MPINKNPVYDELKETLGPYAAVMAIADKTREVCDSLDNRINCSTALDYVCKGLTPDPKDFPDHRLDRVKDYISYVDDAEIRTAIIDSYEASLKKYNLVFIYNSIEDEYKRSRIRIILRILWDSRPHKKY